MIHKKGSENVNADALSRSKHLDEPTAEENEEHQEENEVGEMKITFADEIHGDPEEMGRSRRDFQSYVTAVHSMNPETRYEIIEVNELRKLQ